MSLSIKDAQVFKNALKAARAKKRLTQATCAELLGHSLSFQKDLERCRCSPSIEGFYHICRTLSISADDCIFSDSHKTDSTYHELLRLLSQCDEKDLSVLLATATALAGTNRSSVNGILMPQGRKKPAVQIVYLYRRLFFSALLYLSQSVPQTEDCIFHFNRPLRLNNRINPLTDSKKILNQFSFPLNKQLSIVLFFL